MKKLFSILLTAALATSLFTGCTGSSSVQTEPSQPTEESAVASEVVAPAASGEGMTVGLVQISAHPSLDTIRNSFIQGMEDQGYGAVTIDYKNAGGDMSVLNTIVQGFVGDKVDAIVAIATPSAVAAASATQTIPVIFSAATDPVAAKLLTDPAKPDGNVTGVSDAIPVDKIFSLAKELTPDVKTFGFVYNLGEPNSVSVIENAKAYCDANGLTYLEATVANTSEVQQAAQSLVGKIDAFFTPIDNVVAEAMPVYAKVAIDAKIPLYPGADSMVVDGGLATCGIDYTFLGKETATMTVAILGGTAVADLPVVTMENFRPIANQTTANALGVDLSGVAGLEIAE